jgi:homoserine dehydrogenase
MNSINIGLIGYGVVGQGLVQLLKKRRNYMKSKYGLDFHIKTLCDRSVHLKDPKGLEKCLKTDNPNEVLDDNDIQVVIELIGGVNVAKDIVTKALSRGKHVITANKDLIANHGPELFKLAREKGSRLYFESSVGAGIPIIKTISEGIAGNYYNGMYGIINGTCNFILTEMARNNLTFAESLAEAQKRGYAESDPTLDINGMDSTHKLAILIYLAFGQQVKVKDIYREGISHISSSDIEHAERLNKCIKLLAIAKKVNNEIEARVHPTLIPKDHPLASINGIYNAVYLDCDPQGEILLSGKGAGQMAAASGVLSDLINLFYAGQNSNLLANQFSDEPQNLTMRSIDQITTQFYLRFMAQDKVGVLAKIAGILGDHGISINSVTQKEHSQLTSIPVIILTDDTTEKNVRDALTMIQNQGIVKTKPVSIRMENLQ